jgi:sortase A
MAHRRTKILRVIERLLTCLGVLGLVAVGTAYLDSVLGKRQAIAAFDAANAAAIAEIQPQATDLTSRAPDQSLWSQKAKAAFTQSNPYDAVPVAVLRLGRLDLEVPVFLGTDRLTLNRGAGLVAGTALPGEPGNAAISAHRDSFFRPLKDAAVGDTLELQTAKGTSSYVVSDIFITDPLDVSVLDPTDTPALTLITCYPFYYVGFAPDRYIIRATPEVTDDASGSSASARAAGRGGAR